jgi:hypothetical protein
MATDKNVHLQKVLDTHDINKVENLCKYLEKRDNVKNALATKFSKEKASNPIDSGSYAKRTSINTKFDIDCCIPFLKKTKKEEEGFSSLKEMFKQVYKYLRKEYSEEDADLKKENVRKQKVSIGLKFIFDDGDEFELDVVPGRERPNHGDYKNENTDLSLFIHPSERSKKEADDIKKSIKTNIKKHVSLLSGSNRTHERKVSRLLKVWKTEKKNKDGGKLIKSFMMELYTKEAFDNADSIPNGIWEKTKLVMQYIIDNIETKDLVDPANSNNKISDSMSDSAKKDTKKAMKKTIEEIDADSDKIKIHFPINEKYNTSDGEKSDSNKKASASVLGVSKFG